MEIDSDISVQQNPESDIDIKEDDEPVSLCSRLKLFLCVHWCGVVCLLTPILLIPVLTPFPPEKYQWCGYTLMIMAIYWVTECIPLPITSFLPILIFPLTGVMNTVTACKCYMNDATQLGLVHMSYRLCYLCWKAYQAELTPPVAHLNNVILDTNTIKPTAGDRRSNSIFTLMPLKVLKVSSEDTIIMFLGSMALAYAVEQSGLHNRLALCVVRAIGYSHYRLLFALSFTTMFISMWITNTAATTMMVPINFALLKVFEDLNLLNIYELSTNNDLIASDITTCYFCSITYSATIGGIGTLVGTATNLAFKGLFERAFPEEPEYLSFPLFSAFSIPFMLVLEICMYFYMIFAYIGFLRPFSATARKAKISEEGMKIAKYSVDENWNKLGRITFWEIMVIILFLSAILLFFSRSPQVFPGWGNEISDYFELKNYAFILDSAAAIFIVFCMLSLPSKIDFLKKLTTEANNLPCKPDSSVLNWFQMNDLMPYGFMFLLGGGFALSMAATKEYSDLNGQIGIVLKSLETLPNYFVILLIILFTIFVTNFAANVAVANVIVPIVMQMGKQINIHPLWYNIAAGFSASFCFCLPVGTPGNLIVQSAAKIPTIVMVKAGVVPTVTTILITWLSICFWAPTVWPDLTATK